MTKLREKLAYLKVILCWIWDKFENLKYKIFIKLYKKKSMFVTFQQVMLSNFTR